MSRCPPPLSLLCIVTAVAAVFHCSFSARSLTHSADVSLLPDFCAAAARVRRASVVNGQPVSRKNSKPPLCAIIHPSHPLPLPSSLSLLPHPKRRIRISGDETERRASRCRVARRQPCLKSRAQYADCPKMNCAAAPRTSSILCREYARKATTLG